MTGPRRDPATGPRRASAAAALLRRVGGALLAPRATFSALDELSPGTGRHDGALLLALYLAAVGVPAVGDAVADFWALRGLSAAPGLLRALLPALPWLLALVAVEWRLGPARAHRAPLCLVPLLAIDALAHLLPPPGPDYTAAALGGLASLLLAGRVRPAIAPAVVPGSRDMSPTPSSPVLTDMSQGPPKPVPVDLSQGPPKPVPANMSPEPPAPARPPPRAGRAALGLAVVAVALASAAVDLARLVRRWPVLAPLALGDPLPEFAVPLLDGGTLRTADLRGRPHLLIFWTTWCGVCRGEMPMYRALAERYRDRGLTVIAVDADRDGDVPTLVRAYRDAHALPFPIALDDRQMTRGFRVKMFPHLVLIAADGQIRDVRQGRSGERSLAAAIEALLPAS